MKRGLITDLDGFFSEVYQLRDELNDFGKSVSTEALTTIVDGLLAGKYLTVKIQATRDPDLSLGKIESMIKTTFIKGIE